MGNRLIDLLQNARLDNQSFYEILAANSVLTVIFFSPVFIYTMPGYSCTVKERMLYSSCKATLIAGCEEVLKMEISKKVSFIT